jgi:hypothetical protein
VWHVPASKTSRTEVGYVTNSPNQIRPLAQLPPILQDSTRISDFQGQKCKIASAGDSCSVTAYSPGSMTEVVTSVPAYPTGKNGASGPCTYEQYATFALSLNNGVAPAALQQEARRRLLRTGGVRRTGRGNQGQAGLGRRPIGAFLAETRLTAAAGTRHSGAF